MVSIYSKRNRYLEDMWMLRNKLKDYIDENPEILGQRAT